MKVGGYCANHGWFETDIAASVMCPKCRAESVLDKRWLAISKQFSSLETDVSRIEDSEREKLDLIRKLKDETQSHEVFERCKRVLGE